MKFATSPNTGTLVASLQIVKQKIIMKIKMAPKEFHLKIPSKPGVYKIYSLDKNNSPKALPRVLGIDKSGILYIGKSENLKDRLRMLWRVLNPIMVAKAHTFGVNYNSLKLIQKSFPLQTLAVEFEERQNPKVYEKELLEKYRQKYGEVPPLNGSK